MADTKMDDDKDVKEVAAAWRVTVDSLTEDSKYEYKLKPGDAIAPVGSIRDLTVDIQNVKSPVPFASVTHRGCVTVKGDYKASFRHVIFKKDGFVDGDVILEIPDLSEIASIEMPVTFKVGGKIKIVDRAGNEAPIVKEVVNGIVKYFFEPKADVNDNDECDEEFNGDQESDARAMEEILCRQDEGRFKLIEALAKVYI